MFSRGKIENFTFFQYMFVDCRIFPFCLLLIIYRTMEIGKKCKKKCDVSYSQMPTVTESSELNQTTGCEPIFNLSLKPNKIESLKLEGAEFEESTLPIFTGINSHLVTQRRSRKKNISKDSTFKSQTVSSTNKTYHDLGKVKHVVRITDLIRLFFEKAVRNNPYRQPVCYDPSQNEFNYTKHQLIQKIGNIHIPKVAENVYIAAEIIFIIVYIFVYPLTLLFQQIEYSGFCTSLKVFALFFSTVDILRLCRNVTQSQKNSISLQSFEKSLSQIKNGIGMQVIVILLTTVSLVLSHQNIRQGSLFFMGVVLNIKIYLGQISRLENHFFKVTHHEKYWDLIKVIAMNLIVCHFLACALIGIASIRPSESWMVGTKINEAPWWEQYIWSYYFGTTIILTIGFGDLHPGNCIEAFFIIIISFCACMFFGYNINYIGNLINLINQEEVEKNSKLKIFNSLAKRTAVSNPTSHQITNYIVQSSKIRQEFNYAQERQLIQELPDGLRSSFLAEANLKLFNHLRTLIKFSNKSLERLSLNIEAKICHPEQIIKRANQRLSLMILQSGQVGFVANRRESRLHGLIIQRISNSIDQESKLICADLLQNEHINYDIKSLTYSTVYAMEKETFEDCIRQSKEDYQIYRQALDACRYKLNEFGILKCRFCEKQHTLFECPRLHFCPFKKTLPLKKYNSSKLQDKQKRVSFQRNKQEINYYDYASASNFEQNMSYAGLAHSESSIIAKNPSNKKPLRNHRVSFNHVLNPAQARESFLLTMEMVTQIREDIQRLKVEATEPRFEFTLWESTDCDEVYDFKYYFPKYNSNQLDQKYSLLHKSLRKKWPKRFI